MLNQSFWCVRLRTSTFYLGFTILQFCLSLATLILILFNSQHIKSPYVFGVECFLTVTMIIDIIIKCFSEVHFFGKRQNIIDVGVVIILIILLVIINLLESNDTESFVYISVEADQSLTLFLLIFRYVTQIVRLILLLKSSHKNILVQRHSQDVDLKEATKTDRTVELDISYNIVKGMETAKQFSQV